LIEKQSLPPDGGKVGEGLEMHEIEPYYKWRDDYIASEDEYSPFYATEYSEF